MTPWLDHPPPPPGRRERRISSELNQAADRCADPVAADALRDEARNWASIADTLEETL